MPSLNGLSRLNLGAQILMGLSMPCAEKEYKGIDAWHPKCQASMPLTMFNDDIRLKGHTINNRDTVERKLNINVLVVDDNQINRLLLSKVLTKWGGTVDLAENGIEAIEKLELHKNFDVVLMDIYMPKMGGLEAIEIIRSKTDPYFSKVPIIVLTASMLTEENGERQSDGINDYLSKPFETSTLFDKLSRYQQQ